MKQWRYTLSEDANWEDGEPPAFLVRDGCVEWRDKPPQQWRYQRVHDETWSQWLDGPMTDVDQYDARCQGWRIETRDKPEEPAPSFMRLVPPDGGQIVTAEQAKCIRQLSEAVAETMKAVHEGFNRHSHHPDEPASYAHRIAEEHPAGVRATGYIAGIGYVENGVPTQRARERIRQRYEDNAKRQQPSALDLEIAERIRQELTAGVPGAYASMYTFEEGQPRITLLLKGCISNELVGDLRQAFARVATTVYSGKVLVCLADSCSPTPHTVNTDSDDTKRWRLWWNEPYNKPLPQPPPRTVTYCSAAPPKEVVEAAGKVFSERMLAEWERHERLKVPPRCSHDCPAGCAEPDKYGGLRAVRSEHGFTWPLHCGLCGESWNEVTIKP
jgi:hypothetical protein